MYLIKYAFSTLLQIGLKFGHQVTSLELVLKLATRLSHSHCHIALECPIGIISSIELVSSSARVTSLSLKQARKAWRCDSYLQI